jgi:hypothetical protein
LADNTPAAAAVDIDIEQEVDLGKPPAVVEAVLAHVGLSAAAVAVVVAAAS